MVKARCLCALGLAATLTCLVVNCCHAHLVFDECLNLVDDLFHVHRVFHECLYLVDDLFHVHRVFHECVYLVVNLLRWPLGSFANIFFCLLTSFSVHKVFRKHACAWLLIYFKVHYVVKSPC